jgi:ferredoxin
MSSVILMGLILLLAVLFGPVFCGWVCPLGTIQEWIGKVGRKVFGKRYNHFIPGRLDHYMRYLRYGVLVWVVFVIARSGQLLFERVDPYNALFTFWTKEAEMPSLIILALTLGASLLIERPWCKYLCPYGALLGLFNKFRIFKIIRNEESCISCGKCDRSCPMNIPVSNRKTVKDSQCISCLKCTSELGCPVEETVLLKNRDKTNKTVPAAAVAVIVLLLIFGGIGATAAAGVWTTDNDRTRTVAGNDISTGDAALEDVRGSTTFREAADAFGIDPETLLEAFSVTEAAGGAQMKIKDLEKLYDETGKEIGRGSVQLFIALYKGLPMELEDLYLPVNAVEILLRENPDLTEAQLVYIKNHEVVKN